MENARNKHVLDVAANNTNYIILDLARRVSCILSCSLQMYFRPGYISSIHTEVQEGQKVFWRVALQFICRANHTVARVKVCRCGGRHSKRLLGLDQGDILITFMWGPQSLNSPNARCVSLANSTES